MQWYRNRVLKDAIISPQGSFGDSLKCREFCYSLPTCGGVSYNVSSNTCYVLFKLFEFAQLDTSMGVNTFIPSFLHSQPQPLAKRVIEQVQFNIANEEISFEIPLNLLMPDQVTLWLKPPPFVVFFGITHSLSENFSLSYVDFGQDDNRLDEERVAMS
ncbi:unnamed protein product [Protopolystoma xenopodis]|uniref:Apple domain-containing protein n=1 Tax=Protopolystoma xenopodis TaxID=117903 RepID=A0A448XPG7_9PLAT|nr:unnamed protein product [Protopolystoma xenopodis]